MCTGGGGSGATTADPGLTGPDGFQHRTRPYFNRMSDGGRERAEQWDKQELQRFQSFQLRQSRSAAGKKADEPAADAAGSTNTGGTTPGTAAQTAPGAAPAGMTLGSVGNTVVLGGTAAKKKGVGGVVLGG